MKLKPGDYNVRVIVDPNGKVNLGFVMKLYAGKRKNYQEWKEVPASIKESFTKILPYKVQ